MIYQKKKNLYLENANKGFTLIEIILALSVMAILMVSVSTVLYGFYRRLTLRTSADEVKSAVLKSQVSAVSISNNDFHGIHFDNDKYVIFKGDVYNPADPENEIGSLPVGVNVTNITLDANDNVIFDKLTGEPSITGSLKLVSGSNEITFTINSEGTVLSSSNF